MSTENQENIKHLIHCVVAMGAALGRAAQICEDMKFQTHRSYEYVEQDSVDYKKKFEDLILSTSMQLDRVLFHLDFDNA